MKINVLFIFVLLFMLAGAVDGFKKGIIKGSIHLVTSILAITVLIVLIVGIGDTISGDFMGVVLAILLLIGISIVNKITKFIYDTLKIVKILPGAKTIDKICGIAFGVFEVVLVIWILYIMIDIYSLFGLSELFAGQIEENCLLSALYHNNAILGILRTLMG